MKALTATVVGAAALLAVAGLLAWNILRTPAGAERWVRFDLPGGTSFSRAADMLADSGLVRHPRLLSLWGRLASRDGRIQAGSYLLSAAMTPREILHHLVSGQVMTTPVTVPEGSTVSDVASILKAAAGIDSTDFLRFCANDSFAASLGIASSSLEGYLFPDTYLFSSGARPDRCASVMVARLRAVLGGIDWDEGLTQLSLHEILTLASIVEKETALPTERPTVAATYLNRLAIGMKLDADPTVAYGLGIPGRRLSLSDLRRPSPYNTYLNGGLPPGPICSPGLGSIQAVLHPDRSCRAFYFVARGDGSHQFSETFAEHRAAVREYRGSKSSGP